MKSHGEMKQYKQPTDIVPASGGNGSVVPWVVFGAISVVALAVIMAAFAVAVVAICLAVIVVAPSVTGKKRK